MAPLVPVILGVGGSILGASAASAIPALATLGGTAAAGIGTALGGALGGAAGTAAGNAATGKGFDPLSTIIGGIGGGFAGPGIGGALKLGNLGTSAAGAAGTAAGQAGGQTVGQIGGGVAGASEIAKELARTRKADLMGNIISGGLSGGLSALGQDMAAKRQMAYMAPPTVFGAQSGEALVGLSKAYSDTIRQRRAQRRGMV